MAEDVRGQYVWYELMTTDPKAAIGFYTAVIGWGTEEFSGAGEPYTMWTTTGGPLGGVLQLPPEAKSMGAPPHWLGYIGTPDTDKTLERARTLGGKLLVGPMDIPTVGRFAVIADPQGAVFAAFTPVMAPGPQPATPSAGSVSWHELTTTDWQAGFAFYNDLFGWSKMEAMDMGPMGTYQMFGRNGTMLGGMFNKSAEMPFPPHWLYYIHVGDLDATLERVKSAGGTVLNGPMEVPGGDRIAQCMDPQGAAFALHARKR